MQGISLSAFFLTICDEEIGGTYLTFLNTISNIGLLWPGTLTLFLGK